MVIWESAVEPLSKTKRRMLAHRMALFLKPRDCAISQEELFRFRFPILQLALHNAIAITRCVFKF